MNKVLILAGPTASGKSAAALDIAAKIDAVIINADSKQVYKEIPIITAQPSTDEQKECQHLLYGNISATEKCTTAMWATMAKEAILEVLQLGKAPILVGGSGLYIKMLKEGIAAIPDIPIEDRQKIRQLYKEVGADAFYRLLQEIDPETASTLKPNDVIRTTRAYEIRHYTGKSIKEWQKLPHQPFIENIQFETFFLGPDRDLVYQNCNNRFVKMIEQGVLEEVSALKKLNLDFSYPAMKAHGVPELIAYLNNEISLEQAIEKAQQNTRNYIKRQFTWFRSQMQGATLVTSATEILQHPNA